MKAILSQFANKLDDSGLPPNCASTSKKRKKTTKHRACKQTAPSTRGPRKIQQTQAANDGSDLSDGDDDDDDDDDDGGSNSDGNSNGDGDSNGSDDEGNNGDIEPADGLDQDEDVIRAAEAAQQEDIDEAMQLAELEVTVADSEQKTASTALSKVSLVFILPKNVHSSHLNSSLNSRSRSTTRLVFVKSSMTCASLLKSGHSG
jgi:hypothetical protein